MKNTKLISVIVPVLNEEKNISTLHERLIKSLSGFNHEIIYINDGSTDKSEEIINNLRKSNKSVRIINLSRNFGHQLAITCGIDHASGDAVVIIDADLQDPPEIIPQMIKKWQQGFDVVYGIRKIRKGESAFKIITADMFYNFINVLSKTKIPKNAGDFRLISKKVVEVLKQTREYQRFLRGMISWVGFRQTGIEYERQERYSGKTKYTTISMVKFAADALLSFSFFPLRLASLLGLITAAGAVLYIFYTFYLTSEGTTVKGWPSTIVIVLFLGSIQLVTIGIIGEYLGRIYEEIKRRPLYIIDSTKGLRVK